MGLITAVRNAVEFAKSASGEPFVPPPGVEWSEPEPLVLVETEWGLAVPGGDIVWGAWQGVPFDNPLDRLHMVSRLQKTAQDIGFGQEDFLARYSWVTRTKYSATAYEQGPAFAVNAPEVSESTDEEEVEK
jgi:hypothetical protein